MATLMASLVPNRGEEKGTKGGEETQTLKWLLRTWRKYVRAGDDQVTYYSAKNTCVDHQVTSEQFCNTLIQHLTHKSLQLVTKCIVTHVKYAIESRPGDLQNLGSPPFIPSNVL
jgi:hypothetical protein